MDIETIVAGVRRIAVVGGAKNSGKTTVLNEVLRVLYPVGGKVGITSIGIDGEEFDLWLGTPKPGIHVRPGFVVATADGAVRSCGVGGKILERAGVEGPMGELVLFQAQGTGDVLLAGLRRKHDLALVMRMFERHGVERILVDGAYRRMIAADPKLTDGVLLATGAVLGPDVERVAEATRWLVDRLTVPRVADKADRELLDAALADRKAWARDGSMVGPIEGGIEGLRRLANGASGGLTIAVPGAVTDRLLDAVDGAEGCVRVLARDPTRLCYTMDGYAALRSGSVVVLVGRPVVLLGVVVNPHNPAGPDLPPRDLVDAVTRAVPPAVPVFTFEYGGSTG